MPNTPGTVLFPGALDDQDSLFQVANNATTTLNGSIGAGDLSITVTSGALLPSTGAITLVDSITSAPTKIEHVYYTANSSNVLTIPSGGRGADGSTAQSWSGTVYVRARVLASHHTAIRNAVIAVETKLGTSSSTPTAGKVLRATGTGTSAWGAVVDADISSSAAITLSKLAAVTASRALVSDVSGVVSASTVTATELGFLSGLGSLTGVLKATSGTLTALSTTGSGNAVLSISPTLTTPVLGVATATSINKVAFTAPATGATLTLADGSTLATSGANSITFTSTGATSVTLPTSGTLVNSAVTSLSSLTTVGTITSGGLGTGAVLGGVTMTLGTDATGDIYYRNSGGVLTRLAIGSSGNVLTVSGGLPAWGSAGGSSGANPTASVGLSAVNGVASTFLRSDGAPALDVTIAPTWTGRHTFASTSTTGTGATAGSVFTYNSLTTGDGLSVSSTSATSGNLVKITSTSTAASSTLTGLNIAMSGANGTTAQTVTGASISVTNTNATSGTNVALTLTASGATTANTALNVTAGQIATAANGGLSTANGPAIFATGTWITGGSATTTKPYMLIEPNGTTSTGWNTSGTGLGVNAVTGFLGMLLDLQVAGSSIFKIYGGASSSNNPTLQFNNGYGFRGFSSAGVLVAVANGTPMGWFALQNRIDASALLGWSPSDVSQNLDLILRRAAAANLALGDVAAASPVAQTLSVQNVVAGTSNTAGATFTHAASLGTSQGAPGRHHFTCGAMIAASGTTQQTAVDRYIIGATKVLTNNSAITITNLTCASGSVAGGQIAYMIEVTDGTDYQYETGTVSFGVVNKGGVFSGNTATKFGNQQSATAGTLTVTFAVSGANPALLSVNANSSLTPSTGYPRIVYALRNFGNQAVAIQ